MPDLRAFLLAGITLAACSDDGGEPGSSGSGANDPGICVTDVACDDANPCTADVCDGGDCIHAAPCSNHGMCQPSEAAACLCDAGYTGTYCEACADTHTLRADGVCVADPDPDRYLLASVVHDEHGPSLAAVDMSDGAVVPLSPLSRDVSSMAFDPMTETIYGLTADYPLSLVTIDLATGDATEIEDLRHYHVVTGLTFDEESRQLIGHAQTGAPHYGWTYDVDTMTFGTTGTPSAYEEMGLAWDPVAGDTKGIGHVNYGGARGFIFDTSEEVFELDALDAGIDRPGLAYGPNGTLYLIGNRKLSQAEWALELCGRATAALGGTTDGLTKEGSYDYNLIAGGATQIVSDPAGPRMFAHASYGNRDLPPRPLRIATTDPNDVVCLVTYEEQLAITVASDAQLQLLVLASFEPAFTVTVEPGFTPGAIDPPIHHVVTPGDAPPGTNPFITNYSGSDWSALGLPGASYDDDLAHFPVFGTLDWPTGTVAVFDLGEVTAMGGLTKLR